MSMTTVEIWVALEQRCQEIQAPSEELIDWVAALARRRAVGVAEMLRQCATQRQLTRELGDELPKVARELALQALDAGDEPRIDRASGLGRATWIYYYGIRQQRNAEAERALMALLG